MAVYYSPVFFGFRLLQEVQLKGLLLLFPSCLNRVFPWVADLCNQTLGDCLKSLRMPFGLQNRGTSNRLFQATFELPATTAWWRWIAPASGTVTLDTFESDEAFNPVLTVYADTALTRLSPVALCDDASNVLQSRVSFQARAGLEYQIMVDGRHANASGRGNVIVNLVLTPNSRPGAVPGNDLFARRGRLAGANAEGVSMNYKSGLEVDEPNHGSARKSTMWWEWTAPADGLVVISTEGSTPLDEGSYEVNTFLVVYRGPALANLHTVASNDDAAGALWSQVEFIAQRGESYQIMVDGRNANTASYGNLRLRVDQAVSPQDTLAVYPAAEVELPGVAGVRYQLQASVNVGPVPIKWEDIGEPVLGTGEPVRILDAVRGTNKRFYRYVVVP